MGTVHARHELLEPLLVAEPLRDPRAFRNSRTSTTIDEVLDGVRRRRLLDETAIARGLGSLNAPFGVPHTVAQQLRNAAQGWLVANGSAWVLNVERSNPGAEIRRWRAATLLLPASVLVGAALAETSGAGPTSVHVLDSTLAPHEAVVHQHVHLGPMLRFEDLWMELSDTFTLRRSLDGDSLDIARCEDYPEDYPKGIAISGVRHLPGMGWQWMLESAFLAREYLTAFLHLNPEEPIQESASMQRALLNFDRGTVNLDHRRSTLLAARESADSSLLCKARARLVVRNRNAEARSISRNQRRIRQLTGDRGKDLRSRELSDLSVVTRTRAPEEARFIARALSITLAPSIDPKKRERFARRLYQYLRIKVALYGHLVHDPWISGLKHFLDVVKRDAPYVKVIGQDDRLDAYRINSAVNEEAPLAVHSVEVHVPHTKCSELIRQTWDPRTSWIISFVRSASFNISHTEDSSLTHEWRNVARAALAHSRLFSRMLAGSPRLLRSVRGLSLMNWERNGPAWLFRNALERLLTSGRTAAAAHPALRLLPLRTAIHLGEDFDHMVTGLRSIFEPYEWGLIHRGDRLGHALALGLSADDWCMQNAWVRMRPWDRVLDIGFLVSAYRSRRLTFEHVSFESLRAEAQALLARMFGPFQGDPLDLARTLWEQLGKLPADPWRDAPSIAGDATDSDSTRATVLRWLARLTSRSDRRVGRVAMARTHPVETTAELPLIKAIQGMVFRRVERWNTVIEVNPSSNLLIAGFKSLFEQPLFHNDSLLATFNADDPLTFATSLADEYAYAWAGMVGAGCQPSDATERLQRAASLSRRYAFGLDEVASR